MVLRDCGTHNMSKCFSTEHPLYSYKTYIVYACNLLAHETKFVVVSLNNQLIYKELLLKSLYTCKSRPVTNPCWRGWPNGDPPSIASRIRSLKLIDKSTHSYRHSLGSEERNGRKENLVYIVPTEFAFD